MYDFLSFLALLSLGGALIAPLLYGVATLMGMRQKRLYPLLRVRSEGRCFAVEVPGRT
jgi:hypothetical protein